jgi:glutaredoxin
LSTDVELFSSPGCSRCAKAKQALRELSEELGDGRIRWRVVNMLKELDYAVS